MLNNIYIPSPVLLYFIAWCILFFYYVVNKKNYGIGTFIVFIYMVSTLFSIYFLQGYSNFTVININVHKMYYVAFIYLFICICICIWPLLKFSNKLASLKIDVSDNIKIIEFILKYASPFILWGFVSLVIQCISLETAILADTYVDTSGGMDGLTNINWFGKKCIVFIVLASYLWPIFLFSCISNRSSKFVISIASIACVSSMLIGYCVGARVGIFKSCLYFFIVYMLFKNSIEQTLLKRINTFLLVCGTLSVLTLSIITVARFGDSDEDILSWIAMYAGEGALRFSEYVWNLDVTSDGDTCFSLLKQVLGLDTFTGNIERREHYALILKIPTNIFYTFIGDWYIDLGLIPTLLFCVCIFFILYRFLNSITKRKKIHLIGTFSLCLICLNFSFGFTFYYAKIYSEQIYIVITFFILIIIKIISRQLFVSKGR